MPQWAVMGWPGHTGQVSPAAWSQTVKTKSSAGAPASADPANVNLSGLSDANDFSSPDGLWFSCANPGLLWIETDDGAYTDVTNCMLLAAIPGRVGDGEARLVTNVDGAASSSVTTFIGESLGESKLRRFLVGPNECEITGITETPDGKTLFVNIQHPGESTVPNFSTANSAAGDRSGRG